MTKRTEPLGDELLNELVQIARADEAPPLAEERSEAMIAAALGRRGSETATAAPRVSASRRWILAAAAAVLLGVAGYALGARRHADGAQLASQPTQPTQPIRAPAPVGAPAVGETPVPAEPPLEARLESGDLLVATPGARFELLEVSDRERRIGLERGEVLFDVRPLTGEERFEVTTPGATIRVRGTVFSVEVGELTTVRVYEGRVEVQRGGEATLLGAGELWRDGAPAPWATGALEAPAAIAVARRSRPSTPRAEAGVAADEEPPSPRIGAERIRAWLRDGDYERAHAAAVAHGHALLEADALRALGRHEEAADRYDRLARAGEGDAAFAAARLRFRHLGDAAGALASLDAAPAPAALEERAMGLRARLLLRLERRSEARAVARTYLDAHPRGGLADWMRHLVAATADQP